MLDLFKIRFSTLWITGTVMAFQVQPAWTKTYEAIKGESTLTYVLVHPMHKITSVSRDFNCAVDLSPDTLTSHIKVNAAVSSFDSKSSSRDSHAMEWVQAHKFPMVSFVSQSVKKVGEEYLVSGQLTFHGKTRPIEFKVTPLLSDHKIEITGGFEVRLSDFDLKRPSLLFVPTEDKLTISFDLFSAAY